jgi:hypothetical protein
LTNGWFVVAVKSNQSRRAPACPSSYIQALLLLDAFQIPSLLLPGNKTIFRIHRIHVRASGWVGESEERERESKERERERERERKRGGRKDA